MTKSNKMLANEGWKWKVSCYYGPGGRKGTKKHPNLQCPGEREGDLAIETVHKDDHGKDVEVEISEAREDIGSVVVVKLCD